MTQKYSCFHCETDLTGKPKSMVTSDISGISQSLWLCGECDRKHWEARWSEHALENKRARERFKRLEIENQNLMNEINSWKTLPWYRRLLRI